MKIISFFLLLSLFIPTPVTSQIISNVRAFSEENKVLIVYDLFTSKEEKEFYVTLSSSTDNGKTYSIILNKVSGDVLRNVSVGSEKKIVYLPETPLEGTVFKVEGMPIAAKKLVAAKIRYPIFEYPAGKIELLKVSCDNSLNLELLFKFENNRVDPQFIFANFLMLDDHDVVYRKYMLENEYMLENGNLFTVNKGKTIFIKIVVPNLSEKAVSIQKLEFNLSEIFVKIHNIRIDKDGE